MKKAFCIISSLFLVLACTCSATLAQLGPAQKENLRVMTYNANEGSDFLEVQQATNGQQFLVAVGQTITQVRATNPPSRMRALAKQIIAASPALVSVQELDQWSSGPLDPLSLTCGPVTLEYDMVKELQEALASQGGHYRIAVQAQQYAFPPIPGLILPSTFLCVQVVNHIAIFARTDLESESFQWSNPQSGQYASTLQFPTPFGTLPLPRAWVSVDASSRGKSFRFLGTHLESVDPTIRRLQGAELRNGPGNTSLPIVLAMDSNAPAAPLPFDPAYSDFTVAGYSDVWSAIFPTVNGFTCCQSELDNNPVSQLSQRIDLILTLGPIRAQSIGLFGASPNSRTREGLWPSDHAGVAAQLVVKGDGF